MKPTILSPLASPMTLADTEAVERPFASATTFSPSTSRIGAKVTTSPTAAPSFSTFNVCPWATLYCLPPVLITAYIRPKPYTLSTHGTAFFLRIPPVIRPRCQGRTRNLAHYKLGRCQTGPQRALRKSVSGSFQPNRAQKFRTPGYGFCHESTPHGSY